MTFSYSGNPSASQTDEVRFHIGDTSTADPQLTNEEIAYLLTSKGSVLLACVEACNALIAKYSRLVTQSVGAISIQYSNRIKQYQELKVELRKKLGPIPYAGGISVADEDKNKEETDWDQPKFSVGMHDRKGR